MKIAFIYTLYAPHEKGGAERTARIIAEAAVNRGHEVVVITLSPDGTRHTAVVNGVRVYYVPLANVYWNQGDATHNAPARMLWHSIDAYNPIMGARVREILRQERPDVVQAGNLQGFSVSAWCAAAALRIPLVQMLHDYYLACPRSAMFRDNENCRTQCASCRLFGTPRRLQSNLPAAVISLSRRLLERIEAAGLFSDVANKFIIHGAHNTQASPTPRFDKPPGSPIVAGYLGRMESTKGVEILIDAVRMLSEDRVILRLGGTGDPEYVRTLERRHVRPNIRFDGFVSPTTFLGGIDVLIVPSMWEEPLGRVIYEAYAHGVPVIVSDAGGMPEIVDVGATGFTMPRGDAGALARCLERQIEAGWPGGRFFDTCLERSRHFHIDRVFDDYFAAWQAAMHARFPVSAKASALVASDPS